MLKMMAFAGAAIMFLILSLCSAVTAQTVNRGYESDEPIQVGMLVREKEGDSGKVEPLKTESLAQLKGVVVNRGDSPVTIASAQQTVFVATGGKYEVLVSNENGQIKKGDYLSISSLPGIAMKAKSNQAVVVGRAAADFRGNGDTIGTTTQSDNKTVHLGRIVVDVAIGPNPIQPAPVTNRVEDFLQNVTTSVAGESVTPVRAWLALLVFIVASGLTGTLIYGGARSSLVALGRNPLSRRSIMRGLIQVILMGMLVFISGMFGVYLLLKL